VSGGLGLSIEGPSKAEIQCKDNKDGTCTISYVPTLPGEYKIVIKYAGQPISDTPYFAKISAPCESLNESLIACCIIPALLSGQRGWSVCICDIYSWRGLVS